jgi:hypothetical protein
MTLTETWPNESAPDPNENPIAFFIAVYGSISDNDWSGGFIIGGSCLGMAVWVFLIAQIIHIRANTEK